MSIQSFRPTGKRALGYGQIRHNIPPGKRDAQRFVPNESLRCLSLAHERDAYALPTRSVSRDLHGGCDLRHTPTSRIGTALSRTSAAKWGRAFVSSAAPHSRPAQIRVASRGETWFALGDYGSQERTPSRFSACAGTTMCLGRVIALRSPDPRAYVPRSSRRSKVRRRATNAYRAGRFRSPRR